MLISIKIVLNYVNSFVYYYLLLNNVKKVRFAFASKGCWPDQ